MPKPRINVWLLPLAWIYGVGVWLRNWLFERGYLRQQAFDVPVISVGNLAVGGTGKTPHVEYLLRLLSPHYACGVLSRGYKRSTTGHVEATAKSTAQTLGDEPYQMHVKYGRRGVRVAVNANRCAGIQRLLRARKNKAGEVIKPACEVVLLDDAYQHRYVKPGLSILLTGYSRPYYQDELLPAGRLREPAEESFRADIIIMTKCPRSLTPFHYAQLRNELGTNASQAVYFTTLAYGTPYPLYATTTLPLKKGDTVLVLAGIARPAGFIKAMKARYKVAKRLCFSDHHNFTPADVARINKALAGLPAGTRIITTEKDAVRLLTTKGLSAEVQQALWVQPIEVEFLDNGQQAFNTQITDYVRKNQSHGRLAQG